MLAVSLAVFVTTVLVTTSARAMPADTARVAITRTKVSRRRSSDRLIGARSSERWAPCDMVFPRLPRGTFQPRRFPPSGRPSSRVLERHRTVRHEDGKKAKLGAQWITR